jgi:hypothetical protein
MYNIYVLSDSSTHVVYEVLVAKCNAEIKARLKNTIRNDKYFYEICETMNLYKIGCINELGYFRYEKFDEEGLDRVEVNGDQYSISPAFLLSLHELKEEVENETKKSE